MQRARCSMLACTLLALCAWSADAVAGIRKDTLAAIPNADFSSGLLAWHGASSAGAAFFPSSGPDGSTPCVLANPAAGALASLSQTLPVGSSAAGVPPIGAPGDKLEFGARVRLAAAAQASVWLEIVAATPSGPLPLARSIPIQLGDAQKVPSDQWLWIATRPLDGVDGRLPDQASHATLVVHVDGAGPVWIDSVACGRFEHSTWALAGAEFEGGVLDPDWVGQGSVSANDPQHEPDAYRGRGYAKLSGAGSARLRQALALDGAPGTPGPKREVAAGVWLYLESDVQLPVATGNGAGPQVTVSVKSWDAGLPWTTARVLAQRVWKPRLGDVGRWTWIETAPLSGGLTPYDRSHVALEVDKRLSGTLRVDGAQLGERFGVDGVPRPHVTANYVGPFRSPLSAEAQSNPPTYAEVWRNWWWTTPPACDVSNTAFFHQPDCSASPACFRLNGRRDGAASTVGSIDDLPLFGAYDSRDRDVLRAHLRLAKACGVDSFTYLHQGHTLAQQTAAFGLEPLNEQAFEALVDVAAEADINFKVAVMYEPKVHFNGWVQGEPTHADKLAGIAADLAHLSAGFGRKKVALRRHGALVVYLFQNDVCDASGVACLSPADWDSVKQMVESASGDPLCLIADVAPPGATAFAGLSRWNLVDLSLLAYRTWSQVAHGQAAVPAPTAGDARSHADAINDTADAFAAFDDRTRFAVAMAWPGFDDSAVAGWGAPNLDGSDGAPLCVRIAPDLDGAFFQATLDSATKSAADWIQVATWNDWNESTAVEPRWRAGYADAVLAGQTPDSQAQAQAFARLTRLQACIARRKGWTLGVDLSPSDLEAVARQYLILAATSPAVVRYD